MKLQQVMSHVRRTIDDFQMIEEGRKIAIGILNSNMEGWSMNHGKE